MSDIQGKLLSAHAGICDYVHAEAGMSDRSKEADMLSEISFGL